MSWTKRQFVEQAFEEIGISSYTYNLSAEQLQGGLRRLDSMMATWNGKGIRVGYPLPGSPELSSLDDKTDVPDIANEAIYTNLALAICPMMGKQIRPEHLSNARRSYDALSMRSAKVIEMQLGAVPAGAGNKPWRDERRNLIEMESERVTAGGDSVLELERR